MTGESFPQNFLVIYHEVSGIYIIETEDEVPLGQGKDHSLLYPRVITFVRLITGHVVPLHGLGRYHLVYSFEIFIYIALVWLNSFFVLLSVICFPPYIQ